MGENIKIIGSGLVCDNTNCDWIDETIKDEDLLNWVNKPCPKCGENVLTEKDYVNVLKLNNMVDYINSLTPTELDDINYAPFVTTPINEIMEKLKGLDINKDMFFSMTIDTHGELKVTDIKKIENGTI